MLGMPGVNADVILAAKPGADNNFVSLPTGLCVQLHSQRTPLPAVLEVIHPHMFMSSDDEQEKIR